MKDLNRMFILGRLGADPERRETKNGVPIAHFTVATTKITRGEKTDPSGEVIETDKEITQWHRVVAFGTQAELCLRMLRKGDTAMVVGTFQSRKWVGADKQERTSFEVVLDEFYHLGRRHFLKTVAAAQQVEAAPPVSETQATEGELAQAARSLSEGAA